MYSDVDSALLHDAIHGNWRVHPVIKIICLKHNRGVCWLIVVCVYTCIPFQCSALYTAGMIHID